jgi:hypothetical protein
LNVHGVADPAKVTDATEVRQARLRLRLHPRAVSDDYNSQNNGS